MTKRANRSGNALFLQIKSAEPHSEEQNPAILKKI